MSEIAKRDYTVTVSRTVGMLFIVLCHLFGYGPITSLSFLSEVFNVGTSLFLFISGFLYGQKKIDNYPKWYFGRFKRICFPMYVWMIIIFMYRFFFVTHTAEPLKYLIFALNLQGLGFIYNKLDYSVFSVEGADQLWFLTVIMLCYLLVPLLSKFRTCFLKQKVYVKALFLVAAIVCQTGLSFLGINLNYFLLFGIGYLFSSAWNRNISVKIYSLSTVITVAALAARFGCSMLFGDNEMYASVIVPLTQDMFAIWIYLTIFLLSKKAPVAFNRIASGKAVTYIDELSFYIYITHFMFIAGTLSTLNTTSVIALNIIITLAVIIVSAVALKLLCRAVIPEKR